ALAKAFLSTALAATAVPAPSRAQQAQVPPLIGPGPGADPGAAASATAPVPPINPARGARHLLRNGWDYVNYQEYEPALIFFREAEARKNELPEAERLKLTQGIERAQRGLREASNGVSSGPAYARSGRNIRPGALALASPAPAAVAVAGPSPGPGP